MTLKVYNKPNRTKPRYFSPCDVARVAFNCVDDTGADRELVLACVAEKLGLDFVATKRGKPKSKFTLTDVRNGISEFGLGAFVRNIPVFLEEGVITAGEAAVITEVTGIASGIGVLGLTLVSAGIVAVLLLLVRILPEYKIESTVKVKDREENRDKCNCKPTGVNLNGKGNAKNGGDSSSKGNKGTRSKKGSATRG